jgi:hypothetical protein
MSVSFDITESMLFRQFDDTESSAIDSVSVLHQNVTVAYKSNPSKQYIFRASEMFGAVIRDAIRHYNSEEISIGSLIAKARKSGDLEIIEI